MGVQPVIIIIILAILAFGGFVIYFIFKNIEFTIQAINLYKKMIDRQDVMIKLFNDLKPTLKVKDTIKPAVAKKEPSPSAALKPGATNTDTQSKQKESKDKDLTAKQRTLMQQYNISYNGSQFMFQTLKYDKLGDAVEFAKFSSSL